jgi:hypothetical protein
VAARVCDRHLTQRQIEELWIDLARRFRRHKYLKPHCCVLMSNHFHGLFEVPDICYEMAECALRAEFQQVSRSTDILYQKEIFKMERIPCFAGYRQVYKYIYRNPVEAGLCAKAEHYPFSSLSELIGYTKPIHFVSDSMGIITNPFQILNWLNDSEQLTQQGQP